MIAIDMPSAQYLAQIAPALDALRLKVDLGVLNCTDQRSAYGNSHGAWGCCYRRPAPFPTWAEAEGTGLFGLAQATSGAVVRTAVAACRPLPARLVRRWHRGRCLGLWIPQIGADTPGVSVQSTKRGAPSDSDLGASSFSADISGSTFDRKLFPVMPRGVGGRHECVHCGV
jgi:hypothetical protein